MSLFDKWKKKDTSSKMTEGWDAIVEACEKVYPDQKEPLHYGTIVSWKQNKYLSVENFGLIEMTLWKNHLKNISVYFQEMKCV